VLADPELATSLAGAGRSMVVDGYDLNALLDREIALLQAVGGAARRDATRSGLS